MAAQQSGHSLVDTTFIELTAIALFAILAGMSDDMGKIMLIFMWGLVLGYMLLHTSQLASIVKAL